MPKKPSTPRGRRSANSFEEFNPNSFNAQFASLHAKLKAQDDSRNIRMDAQDKKLDAIQTQTTKTNGRVTALEGKWKWLAGWVAGACVAGAAVMKYLSRIFP